MKNLVGEFKSHLLSKSVEINNDVSEEVVNAFEVKNDVSFPTEFRAYLKSICGLKDDVYDGLATFWAFDKYTSVTKYFRLHEKYYPRDEGKYPMQFPTDEDFKQLRSPLIISEDNKINNPQWLVPEVDYYYFFADYNIEAVHCAIKLKKGECNTVIAIYEHVNTYRVIANSFSGIINNYFIDGPESIM